jgi:hypothetical protein
MEDDIMIRTDEFRNIVDSFNDRLAGVPGDITGIKLSEEKWSLKEIIGHLIDSASNNHQRFVRLQFGDLIGFPAYDAETWISAQKYNEMDWIDLITLWYSYNRILLNVIEGIDDKALDNAWKVSEKELSLGFLAKDYYRHLKWHIEQFESRLNEINDSVR